LNASRGGRARKPVVAIVGLGLVGGSLARALTGAGYRVIGVDRRGPRRRARSLRAVAATRARLERAAAEADVVVLAAPPDANLDLLRRLARLARPDLVVTDVGSVKVSICREAHRRGLRTFVGGHPMAGNEGSGLASSSPGLFRGRPWVLTPAPPGALRVVRRLVRDAGGRPVVLDPAAHDRMAAFLSHAPQVASWAIAAAARADPVARRLRALAGPGFRDMTRLARGPRRLWRQILAQNRREVARALAAVGRGLRYP
jgi:prephenate dehydrogenase